jgi:hypothetical protein
LMTTQKKKSKSRRCFCCHRAVERVWAWGEVPIGTTPDGAIVRIEQEICAACIALIIVLAGDDQLPAD